MLIRWLHNNIPIVHTKIREITDKGEVILACRYSLFFNRHIHLTDVCVVRAGGKSVRVPVVRRRTDVDLRVPYLRLSKTNDCAVLTSFFGNFAEDYNVSIDDDVWIFLTHKRGYKKQFEAHQYRDSDDRNDYRSDECFANFRELAVGELPPETLYRSSNPLAYKRFPNRSRCASKMLEKYHIASIVNMENTERLVKKRFKQEPDTWYHRLWKKGCVYRKHLTTDMNSSDFVEGIIDIFKHMTELPLPILVHCNQGKNRTGCICAWISALMGASYDEIVSDYMLSFTWLHDVDEENDGWKILVKGNIEKNLKNTFLNHRYKRRNPRKYARAYLIKRGMQEEELDRFVAHLARR